MNFQEVILVPRSEYMRFDTSESKDLNLELTRLKNNNSLTAHERNTKYVEKLHDLMAANKELRAPMVFPLEKVVNPPPVKIDSNEDSYAVSQINKLLPAAFRKKGFALYERLRASKRVEERDGGVKIGNVLLDYTLFDYVAEAMRSSGNMSGYKDFVELLKSVGARSTSINNEDYKMALDNLRIGNKKKVRAQKPRTKKANIAGSGCVRRWKKYNF